MSRPQKPTIQSIMTASPFTVDHTLPIHDARRFMKSKGIRHLPVLNGARLCGVISEREVHLGEALQRSSGKIVSVAELCVKDALYTVTPETSIEEVSAHMAREGIGSALVVDAGELVGIFTTVDACRELSNFLKEQHERELSEALHL